MPIIGEELEIPVGGKQQKARIKRLGEDGTAEFDLLDSVGNAIMSTAGKLPAGPVVNSPEIMAKADAQFEKLQADRAEEAANKDKMYAANFMGARPQVDAATSRIQDPAVSGAPMAEVPQTPAVDPALITGQQAPVSVEGGTPSVDQDPFSSGAQAERAAIKKAEQVGTQIAAAQYGAAQEVSKINDQRLLEMQTLQREKEQQLADAEAKRQEAADSVKDFAFKDYFADASTGQRIGTAFAIMLGGLSQGLTGNKDNPALQSLDAAIQRDIKLQQLNYDKLKGAASEADSTYARVYRKLGDKDLAAQQTYISTLEAAKQRGVEKIASYGGEQAKANGMAALAALQTKIDNARAEYGLKQDAVMAKKQEAALKANDRYVPGYGMAYTATDATALKQAVSDKSKMDSQVAELINLRKTYGGEVLNRDAVARAKQLSNDILLTYKNLAKLGVLSASDESIINEIVPKDPLQFTPFSSVTGQDPVLTKLEAFKRDNDNDFRTKLELKLQGAPPADKSGAEFRTVNGKTYQKVTGGWKLVQ